MPLRVLLADADGTLFDFHRGEAVAIGGNLPALRAFPQRPETWLPIRASTAPSGSGWSGEKRPRNACAWTGSREFLRETRLDGDARALCDCFVELLGQQRYILPGAEDFCRAVSARMPIFLITNGIFSDSAQPLWRLRPHALPVRHG